MTLNDLSGKAFTKLSKSVWITQKLLAWSKIQALDRTSSFLVQHTPTRKKRMSSPTNELQPIDETRIKLIELLTQKHQLVFDPNMQNGGHLAAAAMCDRLFFGIAATQTICDQATQRFSAYLKNAHKLMNLEDRPQALSYMSKNSMDCILTELPRFDFKGHQDGYAAHLAVFKKHLEVYVSILRPGAYMALVVSDQRYQDQYYCRHADIMQLIHAIHSLKLQGLINLIRDSQALKAYGYPSTYVPNIINQFVIISRKNPAS